MTLKIKTRICKKEKSLTNAKMSIKTKQFSLPKFYKISKLQADLVTNDNSEAKVHTNANVTAKFN